MAAGGGEHVPDRPVGGDRIRSGAHGDEAVGAILPGQKAAAQLGGDTPDGTVEAGIRAIAAGDWEKVFSLIAPDELPLYDYRAALSQMYADTKPTFTLALDT